MRIVRVLLVAFALLMVVPVTAQEHVSSIHLGSRYEKSVERDGYWYLVGQWGLECWRIGGNNELVKLSEASTPGLAQWVALEGDYAYVADGYEGLSIINVSDPYNLRFVSNFMPWPTISTGVPGHFEFVSVHNHIVYLSGYYGIAVVDVSVPEAPVQTDRIYYTDTLYGTVIDEGNRAHMTLVRGMSLYAAFFSTANENNYPSGVHVFDVSDPTHPQLQKIYNAWNYDASFLALRDSALFVAGSSDLRAFLIGQDSLIEKDSIRGLLLDIGTTEDMSLFENTIILAGTGGQNTGGIANVDITNLDSIYYREIYEKPVHFNCAEIADSTILAGYFHWDILALRLGSDGLLDSVGYARTDRNVQDLALYGDLLFIDDLSNGILIYDVSDKAHPVRVSELPITNPLALATIDGYLFVGSLANGALVYDIRNPACPFLTDSLPTGRRSGFCGWNDLVFVGSGDDVEVYDFSADTLRFISTSSAGGGHEMKVRDSLLFSVGGVAKINNDTTLTLLSQIGSGGIGGFDVIDSFYFAARGFYGLHIFSVADPARPVFLTYWDTFAYANPPGGGTDVRVLGNTALLLDGDWGITEIDVSNPLQPGFLRRITTPGVALAMAYDDRYLYVADMWGVEVFSHDFPTDTDGTEPALPRRFNLYQNYPNPFNSGTVIRYDLYGPAEVELSIFNVLGRQVRRVSFGRQDGGTHSWTWDGRSQIGKEVASGVYFYQVRFNSNVSTKKMILMQ